MKINIYSEDALKYSSFKHRCSRAPALAPAPTLGDLG